MIRLQGETLLIRESHGQISAFRFNSAGPYRPADLHGAGVRLDDGRPAADGVYRVVCSEYSGGDDVRLSSKITFFGLIIAQLALVFVLSGMVQRLSAGMATTLFMLYSALTGLTLSSIFIAYTYSSIASTFVVTGGMFGAMSLYGYTTKRDLSGFGSMLFMGLIGIVLASLVNLWLKSEALMWAVTYIGVVLFVGLTAYDTQKLKNIGEQIDTRDSATLRKYSILGALTLYLDFINLFLMLLRIMGNRR